ncbi:MAG: hypothetical protein ACOX3T_08120 [Bdellovibrionota bacterium]
MTRVKISVSAIIKAYFSIYMGLMLVFCISSKQETFGEADDYILPAISIINEQNISVSKSDVELAKKYFPAWEESLPKYRLSGKKTRSGEEMAWYFATYSLFAVPYILLLKFFNISATYAFTLTNLTCIYLLMILIWEHMKISDIRKLALIILLTINPILFYYVWPSAETFIFAFIGMALVFWYNREYKRAAIFISIAGTMNPTVIVIGMGIVVDYFINILSDKQNGESYILRFKNKLKDIFLLGSSFLIFLVPLAYNYYHVNHINLTASYSGFTLNRPYNTTLRRLVAYMFDLNYGVLPYFPIILSLAIILFVIAIFKKQFRYVFICLVWLGMVYSYSLMVHINSGMAGIARYNAWGSVIIVFAVCIYFDKLISSKWLKRFVVLLLAISPIISAIILQCYGLVMATNTSYVYFTPIAKYVLNNAPYLYNPLHSTFSSRVTHVDGGYNYQTPLIYSAKRGYVRKILATAKDKARLRQEAYFENKEDTKWFYNKLSKLTDKESYISIPKSIKIKMIPKLKEENTIYLGKKKYNAKRYIIKGLPKARANCSPIDGKVAVLRFRIDDSKNKLVEGRINIFRIRGDKQRMKILVNKEKVKETVVKGKEQISFIFYPKKDIVNLKIKLVDTTSKKELKSANDFRALGACIESISFNIKDY